MLLGTIFKVQLKLIKDNMLGYKSVEQQIKEKMNNKRS